MSAELSWLRNMMVQNFQSPSYPTLFWKPKENGVQLSKGPMEFIMLSLSRITISKVQISKSGMITSSSPNLWMETMQITKWIDGGQRHSQYWTNQQTQLFPPSSMSTYQYTCALGTSYLTMALSSKQPHGSSLEAIWNWQDIFSSLPPTKQWQIGSIYKYLKPTLKKLCEKDPSNWDKYINQALVSYRVTPNLATAETPFFLVYGRDPNLPLHQLLEPMQWF